MRDKVLTCQGSLVSALELWLVKMSFSSNEIRYPPRSIKLFYERLYLAIWCYLLRHIKTKKSQSQCDTQVNININHWFDANLDAKFFYRETFISMDSVGGWFTLRLLCICMLTFMCNKRKIMLTVPTRAVKQDISWHNHIVACQLVLVNAFCKMYHCVFICCLFLKILYFAWNWRLRCQ